jgi:hypothetical protein
VAFHAAIVTLVGGGVSCGDRDARRRSRFVWRL